MVEAINFLKNAILDGERKSESYAKPGKRDIYSDLVKKPRMHVVYGMRGGGKTTALFQRYMDYEKGRRVYFSGDELEILNLTLLDLFNNLKYVIEPKGSGVFLDEITKIKDWKKKLKVIYDNYPELDIYASGSSAIELIESKNELARRAKYHHLLPMTFREFMKIVHGIDLNKFNLQAEDIYTEAIRFDIYFKEKIKINPSDLLAQYIDKSQPFMLEADEDMLMDLMDKIIYEDIAKAYKFDNEVINRFHRLILILSMSEKTSYDNISKDIGVSKGVVGDMVRALINSSVIKAVLPYGSGRIVGRKTWRYFFLVPAIRKMYMKKGGAGSSLISGMAKEDIFVSHLEDVFYLPSGPDFVYKGMLFEVGSKNKGFGQFAKAEENKQKFIVYDGVDISRSDGILKIPFYIFLSHL